MFANVNQLMYNMDILDIFSWLPAKEISLEEIRESVLKPGAGEAAGGGLSLQWDIPKDADENSIDVTDELTGEGKSICYLLRNGKTIAVIGYR